MIKNVFLELKKLNLWNCGKIRNSRFVGKLKVLEIKIGKCRSVKNWNGKY